MSASLTPLFPLHAVLFPDGQLPLRVFEPRYVDMVTNCLRQDSAFGVALILDGSEVGKAASTHRVGTFARIEDFNEQPDGILGITARGGERFSILRTEITASQLIMAEVEPLAAEPVTSVPEQYAPWFGSVVDIAEQFGYHYGDLDSKSQDACWLGYRLAELLPLPLEQKQQLLEMEAPLQRLATVTDWAANL